MVFGSFSLPFPVPWKHNLFDAGHDKALKPECHTMAQCHNLFLLLGTACVACNYNVLNDLHSEGGKTLSALPATNNPGSYCHTHELQSESCCPGVFHPCIWVSFTRCNIKSRDVWLRTDLSAGIRAEGICKQILQSKYCLESYISTELLSMLGKEDNSEQKSPPSGRELHPQSRRERVNWGYFKI